VSMAEKLLFIFFLFLICPLGAFGQSKIGEQAPVNYGYQIGGREYNDGFVPSYLKDSGPVVYYTDTFTYHLTTDSMFIRFYPGWFVNDKRIDSACTDNMQKVVNELVDFDKNAYFSDNDALKASYDKIQTLLSLSGTLSQACLQATNTVYLMGSAALLEPAQSRILPTLIYFLARENTIEFLSSESRSHFGGLYQAVYHGPNPSVAFDSRPDYLLKGVYECAVADVSAASGPTKIKTKEKILVDNSMGPFDIGGYITHEIDHLYRDKFSSKPKGMSERAWVLYDEVMANVLTGFLQSRLSTPDAVLGIRDFYHVGTWVPFEEKDKKEILDLHPLLAQNIFYSIQGDLNLYLRGGDLSQLLAPQASVFLTVKDFIKTTGLSYCPGNPVDPHVKRIYDKVSQAYFGRPLTNQDFQEIFSGAFCGLKDPLVDLLYLYESSGRTLKKTYGNVVDGFNKGPTPIIKQLKELDQTLLNKKSPSCSEFEESLSNSQLRKSRMEAYLGRRLAPTDTVQPGAEGGKTDIPTKPGAEGGKTGVPIQPCLRFSDQF